MFVSVGRARQAGHPRDFPEIKPEGRTSLCGSKPCAERREGKVPSLPLNLCVPRWVSSTWAANRQSGSTLDRRSHRSASVRTNGHRDLNMCAASTPERWSVASIQASEPCPLCWVLHHVINRHSGHRSHMRTVVQSSFSQVESGISLLRTLRSPRCVGRGGWWTGARGRASKVTKSSRSI